MKKTYEVEVAYLLKACVTVDAEDAVKAKEIAVRIAGDEISLDYLPELVDCVVFDDPMFVSATPVEDIEKYD